MMMEPRTETGESLQGAASSVAEELPPEEKCPEEKLSEKKLPEEKPLVRKPDLSTIEVYAFVGPAGTGKSQRASQVARQHGIDLIVDDGLVVSRGRIMAGRSAKSEGNMVRAIRRALFEYPAHRAEVLGFLEGRAPCRLMLLATSEGMMRKIVAKLGLSDPVKIIGITDVATQEEIDNALRERREKKQHVVPVARTQIQRNFAGKLVSQLKDLFKSRDRDDGRTIVKPPFSFDGHVTIGREAILEMCRRLVVIGDHVRKVHEIELETDDDSLEVNLAIDVRLGSRSALLIARLLQRKISVGLSYFTGMDVRKVNVRIHEIEL
ncbi:isopentenyl transferase family protein [uncultured Fretibacterium sp.]|uniref:isopentenyl transferase family protein n=1 Tax=uncultured Fretibacterium sp. TaxID=1678694 RepID=UPI00261C6FF1|nr:isopentenyl transferase family protein [uncultured Fretibacterium sp.]